LNRINVVKWLLHKKKPEGQTEEARQKAYRGYLQTSRPYETIVDRYFDKKVLV